MSVISMRSGKAMPDRSDRKFHPGDYVVHRDPGDRTRSEYWIMQVRGYDVFGQVIVHFVRHKHRKYVPWHIEREMDLVSAAEMGFYPNEV